MKTYYKVVSIEDGERSSACLNTDLIGQNRENAVTYVPGQWATPRLKGSKLFFFESIEDARAFARKYSIGKRVEIWECQVRNPVRMPIIAEIDWQSVKMFWDAYERFRAQHVKGGIKAKLDQKFSYYHKRTSPIGTFGASAIKLTKQIPRP